MLQLLGLGRVRLLALKAGQLSRSRACSHSPVALLVFSLSSALPAGAGGLTLALALLPAVELPVCSCEQPAAWAV